MEPLDAPSAAISSLWFLLYYKNQVGKIKIMYVTWKCSRYVPTRTMPLQKTQIFTHFCVFSTSWYSQAQQIQQVTLDYHSGSTLSYESKRTQVLVPSCRDFFLVNLIHLALICTRASQFRGNTTFGRDPDQIPPLQSA